MLFRRLWFVFCGMSGCCTGLAGREDVNEVTDGASSAFRTEGDDVDEAMV